MGKGANRARRALERSTRAIESSPRTTRSQKPSDWRLKPKRKK